MSLSPASNRGRERGADLCKERSKRGAPDHRAESRRAACCWTDRSPKLYLKSGPLRKPDRGWRLECLLAPRALAAQLRKTAKIKSPMYRLMLVSYSCSF